MNSALGAYWRKWDLHVHTPSSYINHYPGPDKWERFLTDLESLPEEFAVIGTNDYLFIDGYRKVIQAKATGRLPNIATILPIIEFRLNIFGGTVGHLSRVNLHVIFSETLSPDIIQDQFLNALKPSYALLPGAKATWDHLVTPNSLKELGRQIKSSVPAERLADYGSDFEEGFNNLTLSPSDILDALSKPLFKNKYLIGVGKTEWADVKWNEQSIAEKKDIINRAHVVFISAADPAHFARNQAQLAASNVNHVLLDCSDAHYLSSSPEKDRIGNCFTWISADPTFEGLRHALLEYPDRVFIGDLPPKLRFLKDNPGKHIKSLEMKKILNSPVPGIWFDVELDLNPGCVAIIGNKGKGKSALVDIAGLLGSSRNEEDFSFLRPERFRNPQANLAKEFNARLVWQSGEVAERRLSDSVASAEVERVRYLPQNLLETICNEKPGQPNTRFEQELNEVIYSHVPIAERLGQASLQGLLATRTAAVKQRILVLQAEQHQINARLVQLEQQAAPDVGVRLRNELLLKQRELQQTEEAMPPKMEPPSDEASPELMKVQARLEGLRSQRQDLEAQYVESQREAERQALIAAAAERTLTRLETLQHQYQQFFLEAAGDLTLLQVEPAEVLTFEIRRATLEGKKSAAEEAKDTAQSRLLPNTDGSLVDAITGIDSEMSTLELLLDEPRRAYEEHLRRVQELEERKAKISGTETTVGTVRYLEKEIQMLFQLPEEIAKAREARQGKTRDIYVQLMGLGEMYRQIYQPVQHFIESHHLAAKQFDLNFEVSLSQVGFEERFKELVNHNVIGSFAGVDESSFLLKGYVESTNFNSVDAAISFLGQVDEALHKDLRNGHGSQPVDPFTQVKQRYSLEELYDYLFGLEYIQPRYYLESKGKPITQLSPGEKGTLLLMFYLLVDLGDIPIILDQPEENLDNHTIHNLLVPAVKAARARRQVILVTHNPNLAVVGDADQVVCADFNNDAFSYTAGAIENPMINQRIIDILEGTWPAFENRRDKYVPASIIERLQAPLS